VKVPQATAEAQATAQSTPWRFGSVVVAARVSDDSAASVAGGVGERLLTANGAPRTMFAVAVFEMDGLVMDRAVIMTVPPVGMDEGAVYIARAGDALLIEPQAELIRLLQLIDHVTPALFGSLPTNADNCTP
jgi:hypothetical protein